MHPAPNYRGARVPVISDLNLQRWGQILDGYHDQDLLPMIRYGFPIGYNLDTPPTPQLHHHSSALRHPEAFEHYISVESQHHVMCGPFFDPPFQDWFQTNSCMTRAKKTSANRRLIFNLSAPKGHSVNDGIPGDQLDGLERKVNLPTPADLADLMVRKGQHCYLFSLDISRCYKRLPIDPRDWPMQGFHYDGKYYVEKNVLFGSRLGGLICQLMATAVVQFAYYDHNIECFVFYDDYVSAESTILEAWESYLYMIKLLFSLGLDLSYEKCVPPTKNLTWIGFDFSSEDMTVKIPQVKLDELKAILSEWLERESCNEKDLESLIGSLFHISKCAPLSRPFLNSILRLLTVARNMTTVIIPQTVKNDILWFQNFVHLFNGLILLPPKRETCTIKVDASKAGMGAILEDKAYYFTFPAYFKEFDFHINTLECYNVLAALRLYGSDLSHKNLNILSDNTTTVAAINKGKIRDGFMASVIREISLLCAAYDIQLHVQHVSGTSLEDTADALSRVSLGDKYIQRVQALSKQGIVIHPYPDLFFLPPLFLP